jgi:NAD(P)-dependent dehydrogenase (short-subunit alcohol dehydrogenase family)
LRQQRLTTVNVVFSANDEPFDATQFRGQSNFVTIVIYPKRMGMYKIDIVQRSLLMRFGPITNTLVVSKHALVGLTKQLSRELGPFGITVNTILPGYTRTARLAALFEGRARRAGMTPQEVESDAIRTIPMARLAGAEEIAAVAVFLATPAASYVTGVNLPVDGGRLALG